MAHRDVFTLPSWGWFHFSSYFPTLGNAAGDLALLVLTMRQAKQATRLGRHARTTGRRGKHVEEPESQPTTVCPTCGGLKEIWVECDACDGKGEGADGYTCGTCRGHGGKYEKCATCCGTGRVPAEKEET